MGETLNQLSCVSWVSLHGCLLIMSLAFSTFSENWGLQEQCKWYSIPRAFNTPWVIAALKREPLSLWTLECKIPLISWEISTVRFHLFINFRGYCFWHGNKWGSLSLIMTGTAFCVQPTVFPSAHTLGFTFCSVKNSRFHIHENRGLDLAQYISLEELRETLAWFETQENSTES